MQAAEGRGAPAVHRVLAVVPILDDWESASALCERLNECFRDFAGHSLSVLLVDDGSETAGPLELSSAGAGLAGIRILRLKRNLGHQRAIAVGLAFAQENLEFDSLVVMDGDGEDRPSDVPLLVRALRAGSRHVVLAQRGRRVGGLGFRCAYLLYRIAHRILTGRNIQFGNFSALDACALRRLTTMSEIWTHYAAGIVLARMPFGTLRLDRGRRYAGRSRMNLESLVLHGLGAISLYPAVSIRILFGALLVAVIAAAAGAAIAVLYLLNGLTMPGGAGLALGLIGVLLCSTIFLSIVFIFLNLGFRSLTGVIPIRDYRLFVESCERVHAPLL